MHAAASSAPSDVPQADRGGCVGWHTRPQASELLLEARRKYEAGDRMTAMKLYEQTLEEVRQWGEGAQLRSNAGCPSARRRLHRLPIAPGPCCFPRHRARGAVQSGLPCVLARPCLSSPCTARLQGWPGLLCAGLVQATVTPCRAWDDVNHA